MPPLGEKDGLAAPRAPETAVEWEAYYAARWMWLRAPLGAARGSEKDEDEAVALHRAVFDPRGRVLALGRLHAVDDAEAQVRYVAAAPEEQRRGLGRAILHALETVAAERGTRRIFLHARPDAIAFYKRMGYRPTGPGPLLLDTIPQTRMEKTIQARDTL